MTCAPKAPSAARCRPLPIPRVGCFAQGACCDHCVGQACGRDSTEPQLLQHAPKATEAAR
eukprot:6152898-Alexandrium_andersonii.AAC.1